MAHVTLHPEPSEQFPVLEFRHRGEMLASVTIDGVPVIIGGGDAAIVSVTSALIDRLSALRGSAIERMRAEALEPATLAEALAGWSEAEKAGAYGR